MQGRDYWHLVHNTVQLCRQRKFFTVQVPVGDNYYAALNSAVFSDGSFVYIPKGVKSAMELSTYFRINAQETGQVTRKPVLAPAYTLEW